MFQLAGLWGSFCGGQRLLHLSPSCTAGRVTFLGTAKRTLGLEPDPVPNQAQPLSACVILSSSLCLFEPHCPHL